MGYDLAVRGLGILLVVMTACDCGQSHLRDAAGDGGMDAAPMTDAGSAPDAAGMDCPGMVMLRLEGSRVHDVAFTAGRFAVAMADRVALIEPATASAGAGYVSLPAELAAAGAGGFAGGVRVAASADRRIDGFLVAAGARVARIEGLAAGPVIDLPVMHDLPVALDLEGHSDGGFALLVWDAYAMAGEDAIGVGKTTLFVLETTGELRGAPIAIHEEDRAREPAAIGIQSDSWWYVERGWDERNGYHTMQGIRFARDGAITTRWFGPIGNEVPPGGDPLDAWVPQRFVSWRYDLAWTNRSSISGEAPQEALHVGLAYGTGVAPTEELARADAISDFSVTSDSGSIVTAWSTGGPEVELASFGPEPRFRARVDLGPGAIRGLSIDATGDGILGLAYERVTEDGALEAWFAMLSCG